MAGTVEAYRGERLEAVGRAGQQAQSSRVQESNSRARTYKAVCADKGSPEADRRAALCYRHRADDGAFGQVEEPL